MNNACLKIVTVCAALVCLAFSPLRLQALEFNLVDGEPIHTQAELDALQTGDTVVMTCTHCKVGTMSTYNSDPSSPNHLQWLTPGFEKKCTTCGGTMKAVKKGDKIELVCSKCGVMGYITAYKTGTK